MSQFRSRATTRGSHVPGAHGLWRATGMTAARFGKPIVASANSFIDVSPALQAYAALNTNAARGAVRDIEQLR